MSGQFWVVARTKPGRELWAAENVAKQNYIPYLPRITVTRRMGNTMRAMAQPLFGSYLFVQTTGQWRFLLGTFGISTVILFGDSPALLSNQIIDSIKAREVDGCVVLPKPPKDFKFDAGTRVRVRGGVFSGCSGIYEGSSPKSCERVLLDFLGRKTSVLLAPDMLEAA